MKTNVYKELKERGFIEQCSNEKDLEALLSKTKVTCYTGFDATADSLHVGHLTAMMALSHLQKAGHKPIVLMGGGTTLIGDPSGKTEMRKMLSPKEIKENIRKLSLQFKNFISKTSFLNNEKWLINLKYIDFLRDIGKYFRVNEMIKHEGYRLRMEREEGLSFIEFNYQLLQAYDFLKLFEKHNCTLQLGGNDQWGNILAGVDLIHKTKRQKVYGITYPLTTTSGGQKMGKTEAGAVWLDPKKTSPYHFYQYWINVDDRDVIKFLKLFTFIPLEKINELAKLKGADTRKAKETLAFEITKIVHGEKEAKRAKESSKAVFKDKHLSSSIPTTTVSIGKGMPIIELLIKSGLVSSKGEAVRLITQGGVYINDEPIKSKDTIITEKEFKNKSLLLRKGKKHYKRINMK